MTLLGRFVGSEEKADEIRRKLAEERRQDSRRYRQLLRPVKPEAPAPVVVQLFDPRPKRRRSIKQLADQLLEHMTEDIINIVVTVLQESKHDAQQPDGAGEGQTGEDAGESNAE